jgi:hypothetical protein
MKLYFDDEGFDGQLQRTVGKCDSGMANVGECLYIASRISERNPDSWYAEWSTFADRLAAQAIAAEEGGHTTSSASLRLRAAEYYRQAFFWHRDDLDGKELTTAYRASVDAFRGALPDLPRPGRVIEGDTPVADPQAYFQDMRRYTNAEQAAAITCASLVTDNETDLVSTGQGRQLYDAMTCPKTFRRFTRSEGAEGHCEGMAPIVFWTAAFDWLDTIGFARA